MLERLQAEIRLETGQKVTQQELLARLVADAYESRSDVVDAFRDASVPISETQREAFHSKTVASGTETDEEDIDDVLYG